MIVLFTKKSIPPKTIYCLRVLYKQCPIGAPTGRWTWTQQKQLFFGITRKHQVSKFRYTVNNIPLTVMNEQKYLGVTLTHDRWWDSNIAKVTSAALPRLFYLRRPLKQAPPETNLVAYNTFVKPTLEYANVTWSPYTNTLTQRLYMVQRKAIRFTYNKYRSSNSPRVLLKNQEY